MDKRSSTFKEQFKQRTYTWVLRLMRYIDGLPRSPSNDVVGKQLLRSGTSILANYVEGQSASSKKDFINFLNHSLKSANESKVWLALLRDTEKGQKEEGKWLLEELTEIANILASSIITSKKTND